MYISLEYHQIVFVALCFFQIAKTKPLFASDVVEHADPVIDNPTSGPADFTSTQFALKNFRSSKGSDWTVSQMPDLHGRVAIVTGSSSGIGHATALELARHGAKVYMACRDKQGTAEAIKNINAIVPGSNPQFLNLDITSLQSAHSAAHEFLGKENRLDILVNNAGIGFTPYELSEDGIELQLCNAIGHFAFTLPLLDRLIKTSQEPGSHVRIVNVASTMHYWVLGAPDFSSVDSLNRHSYCRVDRYGLSKLMTILFTNELQTRLRSTNIICTSVHPGGVNTKVVARLSPQNSFAATFFSWANHKTLLTPHDGAINTLYAATAMEMEDKRLLAAYLHPFGAVTEPSKLAKDPALAEKFWELCQALVKEKVTDHHSNDPKELGMEKATSEISHPSQIGS